MKPLAPELLTPEKFQPYGNVIETAGTEPTVINGGNCLRYSDLADLDIDSSGVTGISLFDAKPYTSPYQLNFVERHPLGSQAFIPMSHDKFLIVVADDVNGVAQQPNVFLTDGRQGVNYARNIWHGVITPIVSSTQFAVVDYIGANDNLEVYEFDTPYVILF